MSGRARIARNSAADPDDLQQLALIGLEVGQKAQLLSTRTDRFCARR
jgi:hypothetical protein